ncbi:MAG: 2-dehydropantoate 2-reductase [Methylovirgula sp.]
MRILVVGAGAIGGYFGGRLLQAGRDVTFLVRERRAKELARTGLVIKSPRGDFTRPAPPVISAPALQAGYDLILLSCKAFDLAGAMQSFAPAAGLNTAILPLLNGMAHIDALSARFGAAAVLGGECKISAALDSEGRILHLSDFHELTFGELDGRGSPRAAAIAAALEGARFDVRLSDDILYAMWEKWLFIAAAAGITSLLRGTVGDIVAAGAADLATALLDECAAIAAKHGFRPRQSVMHAGRAMLTAAGSDFTASMFRDIERGAPVEAKQIVGDLLARGSTGTSPILRIVAAHLATYEARRARQAHAATPQVQGAPA